jgi:hypothetical protein
MTSKVSLSAAPGQESLHPTADEGGAMALFQNAFDACLQSWHLGDAVVLLQTNIQELFGSMLLQYFEHSLVQHVGQPVTFIFSNGSNGGQTIVQMPESKKDNLHLQAVAKPQAQALQAVTQPRSSYAGIKKAPRPMNCWIIFRDAMHKKLKAENPNLTVQQICKSNICISCRNHHR